MLKGMAKSPSVSHKKIEPVSQVTGNSGMHRMDSVPGQNPSAEIQVSEPSTAPENTSGSRYPLTDEQRSAVSHDISMLKETLQEITALMKAGFGESHQVAIRAEECSAAVQRFEWELDRTERGCATMAGAGPTESI